MNRAHIEPQPSRTTISQVPASPHARRIGIAAAIWGGSILLSRLIGLVREAVIGRTLGAGTQGDLYATAFVVPDFLNYLLAGGALSIVFIPIFGAYLARGEEERASVAFSVVANFLLVLLTAASVILWFAMPALVPIVAPGLAADARAELVTLSRIVLPAQVFHVVGGLLSASMQARDRHALPALAPLVYTLCIIAGGLVGGADHGAYGFAWGALIGSVLGPFLLPLLGAMRGGLRWRATLSLGHPDLRTYVLRSLPIMIGFSIVVVDDWFLKREGTILGTGSAAILTYAKTLMKVPMGVFGLAAGVAVFPTLQRLVAEGRPREMRAVLVRSLRNLIVISFAAQAVTTACSADLIALVYGRARLSPDEITATGVCLAFVSVGLAGWAAQTLIARGFYALGNTWMPALLGTLVAVAAYPAYVAARTSYGLYGLALVSSLAILVYTGVLGFALRRTLRGVTPDATPDETTGKEDPFGGFLARAVVVLVAAIGAGELVTRATPEASSTIATLGRAALTAAAVTGVFLLSARAVGLQEVRALLEPLARRLRRGSGRG